MALSSDEVHVWCASLDLPALSVQSLQRTLGAAELDRAGRFYFQRDRQRFIVAHGLLRVILGCYLDTEPKQLRFCNGPYGKPALDTTSSQATLNFNLSHSDGLALYAIARGREVGIDLERFRPVAGAEQIAKSFFSAQENDTLCALPHTQKREAFFNCWTRKEAYLKACGDGLTRHLNEIDVSLAPGEPARLLSIENNPQQVSRWTLHELAPAVGYVAALCVEGSGWSLACWHWPE